MDCVVINQRLSCLEVSEDTKLFFSKNNLSLDSFSFDLDLLRNLYKQNKTLFYHVVNELSLYGCDFHSTKNRTFFPSPVGTSFKKILTKSSDTFSTYELNELRLWKLYSEYHKNYKKSLNGICLERLNAFVGERLEMTDFAKFGFDIVDNNVETFLCNDNSSVKNIILPVFYIKFISSLWVCSNQLLSLYRDNGIYAYKDFLKLENKDLEKIIKQILRVFDDKYEAGIYSYNLCLFMKERADFTEAFDKEGTDLGNFLNECNELSLSITDKIENHCFFTLKKFNYDFELFKKVNKDTNGFYLSPFSLTYLKRYGIDDLVSFRKNIVNKEISYYRFDDLNNSIFTYCYNPFVVVEYINQEIDGVPIANEEELDFELRKHSLDFNFSDFKDTLPDFCGEREKLNSALSILEMRERGITLEDISKNLLVTRERVRQIVDKFLMRNSRHYEDLLEKMFENSLFYSKSQMLKMIGLSEFINSKHNKTNVIFNDRLGLFVREHDSKAINNFISENSKQTGFNIFNCRTLSFHESLNFAGLFLKESQNIVFNPYPAFTTIDKTTNIDVAYLYLGEKGIKGFDANNDIDEAKKYFTKYDPEAMKISDRALIGRIQRVDFTLVGMSRYARTDFITEEMKRTVLNIVSNYSIDKNFGTVSKEIFLKNEKELKAIGVDNYYFLYGIASKWKMCDYTYAGRSMRIFNGPELSLNQIVSRYIKANGPIVSSKKICSDLGMREVGFEQVDFVSKYDSDTFILTQFIECSEFKAKKLVDFIDKKIFEKGYCLAKEILDGELFFDITFNDFFRENLIDNSQSRLAYAIEIILQRFGYRKYNISHMIHCISLISNPIVSTADVVHQHFQDNEFSRQELFDFLDSIELAGEVTRKEFLKNYVVKVGSDGYVVSKEYSLNVEEIDFLCSKLDEYYSDELCITANEALNKMAVFEIENSFAHNPIGFCSAVSFYKESNWIRPRNNLNYDNKMISILLVNKKMFNGASDITIGEVIHKIIMSINKIYMSYNEISEYLLTNEIISSTLPNDIFRQIFVNDIAENGLVKIEE